MYREFFAGMEWTGLALFAMVLFLALFVLMLLRVFVFHSRRDYDSAALLPFDESSPRSAADRTEVNP